MNISELFYGFQGEGSTQGKNSLFIRFNGCNLKCKNCFGIRPGRRKPKITLKNEPNKIISDVKEGDVLLTLDNNFNMVETTVKKIHNRTVSRWLEIKINETIYYVTEEHPFFTTRGIISAKDLVVGDNIYHSEPLEKNSYLMKYEVQSIKLIDITDKTKYKYEYFIPKPLTVYNLTCEPHPSYLVDNMWVHNCDSSYTWSSNHSLLVSIGQIEEMIEKAHNVVFTGGEPMMPENQKIISQLMKKFGNKTYEIETNGTYKVTPECIDILMFRKVTFNVSPKGNFPQLNDVSTVPILLEQLYNLDIGANFIVKYLFNDENDLKYIKEQQEKYGIGSARIYVQPIGINAEIIKEKILNYYQTIIDHGWNLSMRMHIFLFGNKRCV